MTDTLYFKPCFDGFFFAQHWGNGSPLLCTKCSKRAETHEVVDHWDVFHRKVDEVTKL